MSNRIDLLVLAGPSAGGKTAASVEILRRDKRFTLIRSATTRAPRGDGHDGEYIYLSEDEFTCQIAYGGIVEYMEYAGNMYGTLRSELERANNEGLIPLLILDLVGVQSVSQIPDLSPCCVYIYGDIDVIEARLRERYLKDGYDTKAKSAFLLRTEQNRRDYSMISDYADKFYAFIRNDSSIEDLAERIILRFSDYLQGVAPSSVLNGDVASRIAKMK